MQSGFETNCSMHHLHALTIQKLLCQQKYCYYNELLINNTLLCVRSEPLRKNKYNLLNDIVGKKIFRK